MGLTAKAEPKGWAGHRDWLVTLSAQRAAPGAAVYLYLGSPDIAAAAQAQAHYS